MAIEEIEAEGDTIDEAIASALATLGIDRARARVEILHDARRGVLGFGGQKARVRVSSHVAGPSTDGNAAEVESGNAVEILRRLLELMDVPAEVESAPGDEPGQICLRITSEAGALLIGRHGQTLDALEYLLNRIAGSREEGAGRLVVDAEGYRERRRSELRETAARLAARARDSGREQTMNPLNPRERRVVHLALAADSSVTTKSTGEGPLRRVVISPARYR